MKITDIRDFGAKPNGELCTKAIQAAIDTCGNGGTVYIGGGIYRSGTVVLRSNITLYIDSNATLQGSTDTDDYPFMQDPGIENLYCTPILGTYTTKALIYAEHAENIQIKGGGTIDGCGDAEYFQNAQKDPNESHKRPFLL